MSFKVGDEVVATRGMEPYYSMGARGVIHSMSFGGWWVDFGDDTLALENSNGRLWSVCSTNLNYAHACPIARESAKLAAKVEQIEAEINAWIERMRRGEW